MQKWTKSKNLAVTGLFGAIIFILAFTPIGFIPLPFVRATTIHIPVILGALLLGPKYGAALGFLFGFTSLINNTINPNLTSFVFSPFYHIPGAESGSYLALIVVFIPRILVGIIPWFFYRGLQKILPRRFEVANLALSGVVGSLTNTFFVLHFIYLFFREPYASVVGEPVEMVYSFIMGLIVANGIPEAVVAGILVAALGGAFGAVLRRNQSM